MKNLDFAEVRIDEYMTANGSNWSVSVFHLPTGTKVGPIYGQSKTDSLSKARSKLISELEQKLKDISYGQIW